MARTRDSNRVNLTQEAFVRLLRVREQLHADVTTLLKPHGLTEPQYNVLRILRGAGRKGLPCLEISRRMITRVPDITRLLDRIEVEDLVKRARDTKDRRIVSAHLTAKGRTLLSKLDQPIRRAHRAQFAALTKRELIGIVDVMGKLLAQPR
jgi:DNA-binding MarR family transcriptional regulator